MCQFCVEHGEGERWYLNAKNYAYDLNSDLKRRGYVVEFVHGFDSMRARTIAAMDLLDKMPAPVARASKTAISRNMQKHHFGQPVPIEECEQIFDLATSITVIPCICRMHAPNKNADEVCVLVTTQPVEPHLVEGFKDYAGGPQLADFHRASKAEAMTLLRKCEESGLMHSVWTFETPFTAAICNCNLESGCMAMKLTEGYKMKLMWRGENVAVGDTDRCSGCGECAAACPFSAIVESNRRFAPSAELCWGCGVCRAHCACDAIELVDRRTVPSVAALW